MPLKRCAVLDIGLILFIINSVSDLEEELAPLAISSSVEVHLEILGNQPLYAIGDSDRLYRAISNLITNAI